jgi:hydroxysqualene dehydroxylase
VSLYESARQAGGRCRGVEGHDNGTHVLLGANREALRLLDAVGARDLWVEPEPGGLPIVDLAAGTTARVGLSPWTWLLPSRRPPGLTARELPRLLRLALPWRDRPVAELAGTGAFARAVVEPLTVAALNTPPAEASAARLARVLRRVALAPGAGRLLVARHGHGPDLVEPVLAALAELGVAPSYGRRLRGLAVSDGRAERLRFADGDLPLGAGDEVVLALPPHALARLLPDLTLPDRYEPIVNLHYQTYAGPVRFVGLLGAVAQWALFRPGTLSVTVSAGRGQASLPAPDLAAAVWPEIARAAALLGIDLPPAEPPCRVVKERRATLSQPAGLAVDVPRRPLANVALAGDWLSDLPATIEAAVASGVAAAGVRLRPSPRSAPALAPA